MPTSPSGSSANGGRRGDIHPVDRVLVIGGRFSGLAAAIGFAHAGIAVGLVEKSPHWPADGTGISIGGVTMRALGTLGVLDRRGVEGGHQPDFGA